ncbi:formyl transferase [Planctomicrobium sp. SH668]|uniref:formyl transferase n=1 Tax=Planctomicrobium sp. SH668 TaxID=3448126 RepID=UPI003F5AFC8C
MKIVAISSLGTFHRHVIQQLHDAFPLAAVIQPTGLSNKPSELRSAKLKKLLRHPFRSVNNRLNHWHSNRELVHFEREVEQVLFRDANHHRLESDGVPIYEIKRDQANSQEVRDLVSRLAPDLIVTSGCPILKPTVFEIPTYGTMNVHWGIAPAYRGEDTLFWPLYFGDYSQLGGTIHQIDRSIDRGPILSQFWPEIGPEDTEASITVKTAIGLGKQISHVATKVAESQRIGGLVPEEKGRIFLRNAKNWTHSLSYSMSRRLGRSVIPSHPEREFYAADLSYQPIPAVPHYKHPRDLHRNAEIAAR